MYKRDIESPSKRIFDAENYFGMPNMSGADIDINKWQMETSSATCEENMPVAYF